ncbi:hypothetical protein [Longimicrobium terrae]|uniref:Uncharacterized protein n=1 Tax=Longimicrobium terrae TaxID=1639882 RepID=A0A841H1Z0_9BACT|nr:hypothetical protein [Longimicrobium terrae]MBB4637704.1 hypothetical protein [Longimicrobium terrae]MBB6072101.1 hypothetical protein [Longimicrobium terrae]NNC29816.1 hypothetical protein [Longimicrobium terrae]
MAIWNRNDNNFGRGREGMGGPVRPDQGPFSGHTPHDVESSRYDSGYRGQGGMNQGMRNNSWADGAYTADAADRLDRDTDLGGNRGRDTSPFHDGSYRAGGSEGGYASGMNNNGLDRNGRGWNLGTGSDEWGHNWGGGNRGGMQGPGGMQGQGGMQNQQGGGFLSRAQNAVRRGWDQVEDRFDGDDDRTLAYGARPMGRGSYDRDMQGRGGYDRDMQGRGMTGGYGGAPMRGRMSYDNDFDHRDGGHGYKTRQQTDAGDPFGDRQAHTPIRMVNGGFDDRYDTGRTMQGGMRGGMMGGGMGRDYDHDGDVDMRDRMHGAADRMTSGARQGWNNVRDRFDRDEPNRMNRGGYDRDVRGFNGGRDWF